MKTLSIIGAGKVGQTLARLWHECSIFRIQTITNRTTESAAQAAAFIGAGTPASAPGPADIYMLGAPDPAIEAIAYALKPAENALVFHCSGAFSSELLAITGAKTASLHPFQTFPEKLGALTGTYCALEGHSEAVAVLKDALEKIGARPLEIATKDKIIYHAAAVFASNYMTTLAEAALQCLDRAGIGRETGLKILMPIMKNTLANIEKHGPARALTGPIARGDMALVEKQLEALGRWDQDIAALYKALAETTADIADTNPKISATG